MESENNAYGSLIFSSDPGKEVELENEQEQSAHSSAPEAEQEEKQELQAEPAEPASEEEPEQVAAESEGEEEIPPILPKTLILACFVALIATSISMYLLLSDTASTVQPDASVVSTNTTAVPKPEKGVEKVEIQALEKPTAAEEPQKKVEQPAADAWPSHSVIPDQ